jgi:hypothetical protein
MIFYNKKPRFGECKSTNYFNPTNITDNNFGFCTDSYGFFAGKRKESDKEKRTFSGSGDRIRLKTYSVLELSGFLAISAQNPIKNDTLFLRVQRYKSF